MPFSALGCRFARNIKADKISLDDVPQTFRQDAKDSFVELFGYPLEE